MPFDDSSAERLPDSGNGALLRALLAWLSVVALLVIGSWVR